MARNPFHDELRDTFRGTRVRVYTTNHTYDGWVRIWHYHQPAVILYDAIRDDGDHLSAVTIDDPEIVERLDAQEKGTIEEVAVDAIADSPYSVREHDDSDHKQFVKLTRERGHLLTFPTVRPIPREKREHECEDEYEVVVGHRRVEAARKASLDTIAVRLVDFDDWEAIEHFVDDHIPISGANGDEDQQRMYSHQEIERTLTQLREDRPDEDLLTLDPLAPYLREQLAATRRGYLQQTGKDGRFER